LKTRLGFISNSSSSSFCIYGFPFEEDMISEEEIKKWAGKEYNEDYRDNDFDLYEFMEEKLKNTSLTLEGSSEYVGLYIGRSWDSIEDDETGKMFKNSVEKEAKEIFGKEAKGFGTQAEAWRDG
jgi:hypothetical protein